MGRIHTAQATALTLLADNGDFGALIGTAGTRARIHEIRVWQTGTTTLTLDVLRFTRGSAGAGGGTPTEYDMDTTDTAVLNALSLPTTDVGTATYQLHMGWNLLQEALWLPTPDQQLVLGDGEDLGIGRVGAVAHTGVGWSVTWEEFKS